MSQKRQALEPGLEKRLFYASLAVFMMISWLRFFMISTLTMDRLWFGLVKCLILRKDVYIFGTGGVASQFVSQLPFSIKGYFDNNTQKWGSLFLDSPVLNPSDLKDINQKRIFIFISSSYYEEIGRQLTELGLKEGRHYLAAFPRVSYTKLILEGLGVLYGPLCYLVTQPVLLVKTLWSSRRLGNGENEKYHHFAPLPGINCLFYWTSAFLLEKYGRSGVAPNFALGNYKMSNWFFYTLPSLNAYRYLPNLTLLWGMFGWLFAYLAWLNNTPDLMLTAVLALTLFSTKFYANTFYLQNYNVLGWVFFPIGLYGLYHGMPGVSALAWLAISFLSPTIVFIACFLSLSVAGYELSLWPLLALAPAILKLLTHFAPMIQFGNLSETVVKIMKLVGFDERKARYQRSVKVNKDILYYYLILYGQFLLCAFWVNQTVDAALLAGFLIFLINGMIARFCDHQTFFMMMLSLATAHMLCFPNPWMLPSFWFLASPLPRFLCPTSKPLWFPDFQPFAIQPYLEGMDRFFKGIEEGTRVYFAYNNPNGQYDKVLDGYRVIAQLANYAAASREINLFPNFFCVTEANYEGAPEFWGREVSEVLEQLEKWNASYAVVYQTDGGDLDKKWTQAGFQPLSHFSWRDFENEMGPCKPWVGPTPEWWLLKPPDVSEPSHRS